MKDILFNALSKIEHQFNKDELTYLQITSKIEHSIRDKLAYYLHCHENELTISREWHRVDLAILKDDTPIALIELKSMYTGNFLSKTDKDKFAKYLKDDVDKNIKKYPDIPVYIILLATNILTEIPLPYKSYIKYPSIINRPFKNGKSIEENTALFRRYATEILPSKNFKHLKIISESAFDIKSELLIWLCGPFYSK